MFTFTLINGYLLESACMAHIALPLIKAELGDFNAPTGKDFTGQLSIISNIKDSFHVRCVSGILYPNDAQIHKVIPDLKRNNV